MPRHADPATLAQAVNAFLVQGCRVRRAFAAIGPEVCIPQFFLAASQLRRYQLVHLAPGATGRSNNGNGGTDGQ
ncbi:hypothetical protein D3C76_570300 [compost metagenome]